MIVRRAHPHDLLAVHRLHHDAWVDEGFLSPRASGTIDRHPEFDRDAETFVLVAEEAGTIVGTVSLSLDGPLGLPVDHGLTSVITPIRSASSRLAAGWRVATHPRLRTSAAVIRALMLETIELTIAHNVSTCLFLFHTRHVPVYRRLLRATTVHAAGAYYDDAPTWDAVLMRADADAWGPGGYRALSNALQPRPAQRSALRASARPLPPRGTGTPLSTPPSRALT